MRNLTITRRKSFVASLMKDYVYVSDPLAPELTIEGVPCRKIGDIKNGETKTFSISESAQQIFLIADKASRDYCNASLNIPEGQENLSFSGVHKFYLGSNPFRFDGITLTEQQLAKQKKNDKKGLTIVIVASILGVIAGSVLPKLFFGDSTPDPKTFSREDFQITLTEDFELAEEEGVFVAYQSRSAMVFALREEKAIFGDITLEEYGQLVQEANNKTHIPMNREDAFIWFEYTDTPQQQEIYYFSICCESADAFWIVNFATPASNRGDYQTRFLDWAKSIQLG